MWRPTAAQVPAAFAATGHRWQAHQRAADYTLAKGRWAC
jgi:hypothetical protein